MRDGNGTEVAYCGAVPLACGELPCHEFHKTFPTEKGISCANIDCCIRLKMSLVSGNLFRPRWVLVAAFSDSSRRHDEGSTAVCCFRRAARVEIRTVYSCLPVHVMVQALFVANC